VRLREPDQALATKLAADAALVEAAERGALVDRRRVVVVEEGDPVRSRRATAIAGSVSADHTDEHRPDQVSLACAIARSSSSQGITGSAGPNCSSVTMRRSRSGRARARGA